ncbi:hypothetical protein GCM10027440_04280 [Nocardiopsis coralliicola]
MRTLWSMENTAGDSCREKAEATCGCAISLAVGSVVVSFIAFVIFGDAPRDPPFDYTRTVAVEKPDDPPEWDYERESEKIDRSSTHSSVRGSIENSVRQEAHRDLFLFDTEAECDLSLGSSDGYADCSVAASGVEMSYGVRISGLSSGGFLITWDGRIEEPGEVILTEAALHRTIWEHTAHKRERDRDLEVRCDPLVRPRLAPVADLGQFQCYTWRPDAASGSVHTLYFDNGLEFSEEE